MRISLIVATVERTDELRRLLASLVVQTHRDFEVIVVDQNPDRRLAATLQEFDAKLQIRHLTVFPARGLSRARNIGIRAVTGEVACFPDDDCWYPDSLLQQVDRLLTAHPDWDAMIVEAIDESGHPLLPWRDRSQRVTRAVSWRRAISITCMFRLRVLDRIGGFDESLGAGAGTPWGSGEDNDLMLRAIENGFHVRYEKTLQVIHPRIFRSFDSTSRAKSYTYSLADGRMLRRHAMPVWWRVLFFGVPVARMVVAMLRLQGEEMRFHWATCVGRIRGFRLSG